MKAVIIAAGVVVLGATSAFAQYAPRPWSFGEYPYERRHHRICQEKAWRLHDFERRAAADGRVTKDERRIAEGLRRDLERTCGGFRWR